MPRRSSTPVVIKVEPDGTVLYEFDGHVFAVGLDLAEVSTVAGPDDFHSVQWLQQNLPGQDHTADGLPVVRFFGQRLGDTKHKAQVQFPQVTNGTDVDGANIMDTDGRSDFMRYGGLRPGHDLGTAMNQGVGQATWASSGIGAAGKSQITNVSHGLGCTPTSITITAQSDARFDGFYPILGVVDSNVNSTLFQMTLYAMGGTAAAAGDQRTFYWQAIGHR